MPPMSTTPPPNARWDGTRWVTLDGGWWWDGRQWLPVGPAAPVPPAAPAGWNPNAIPGAPMRTRNAVLIAAVVVLVGLGLGVLLLVGIAYALENVHY